MKPIPIAKGKKRRAEMQDDEAAVAAYEEAQLRPQRTASAARKHRDEIGLGDVIEIVADEIEAIVAESGGKIDRLNAREFFAMNILRPLKFEAGVSFRDQEVPRAYCSEHE